MHIKAGTHVLVEWYDIKDFDDWNETPEYYTCAQEQTLGRVAFDYEDATFFRVATGYSIDEDRPTGVRCIPAGCIISVRSVSIGKELWDVPQGPSS